MQRRPEDDLRQPESTTADGGPRRMKEVGAVQIDDDDAWWPEKRDEDGVGYAAPLLPPLP